jgi:hypothetical protein
MQYHRLESDLVAELAEHLPARFGGARRSCQIQREVIAGRAIADVVALVGRRGHSERSPLFSRPLSARECVVLSVLRRHGATRSDRLPALCGLEASELRTGLWRDLVERNLLRLGPGGRVALHPLWPSSHRVFAIEAKLVRWRDALQQAIEYRRFADFAYVALPEASLRSALQEREVFKASGVGLLAVNGQVRTVVKASRSRDHDWRREFVLSRLALNGRAACLI